MSGSTSASPTVTHSSGSSLLHPVEAVASAVRQVPGAHAVKGAFDGVMDTIGVVSPHTRRVAAYAGVGLLGAVGVVEWPVAAAGAAVVWLTQPLRRNAPKTTAAQSAPAPEAAAAPRTRTQPRTQPRTRTTASTPPTAAKPSTARAGAAKPATAAPKSTRKGKGTAAPATAGTAPGRPRSTGRKASATAASATASS